MLMGKRHQDYLKKGKFTGEDVRRICLWLDLNSMGLGSSSVDPADQAAQRAGKVVWPKLDFDPANPQRIERLVRSRSPKDRQHAVQEKEQAQCP